jgi:hypothetical protein
MKALLSEDVGSFIKLYVKSFRSSLTAVNAGILAEAHD